jgi:hypothetical protein
MILSKARNTKDFNCGQCLFSQSDRLWERRIPKPSTWPSRIRKARQVTDGHRIDRREKSLQLSGASCWIMGRKTSRFSIFSHPTEGQNVERLTFSNLKISPLLILLFAIWKLTTCMCWKWSEPGGWIWCRGAYGFLPEELSTCLAYSRGSWTRKTTYNGSMLEEKTTTVLWLRQL